MAEEKDRAEWQRASWLIWAAVSSKGVKCSPADFDPYEMKAVKTKTGPSDVTEVFAAWPGATTFDASEMDGIK